MDTDKKILPIEMRMPEPSQEHLLDAGYELRISNISSHIKILLLEGQADIFGDELPLNEPKFFHCGDTLAVFCWQRSKLKISGVCDSYASD
jgi:hypothetical protein